MKKWFVLFCPLYVPETFGKADNELKDKGLEMCSKLPAPKRGLMKISPLFILVCSHLMDKTGTYYVETMLINIWEFFVQKY